MEKNSGDYRMLAIDLDGTLLSPESVVTPRTRLAVQRVLSAGWNVCFATGRNWTESKPILSAVGHEGPMVFVGGAMVVDTITSRVLHHAKVHPELARQVASVLENAGHAVLALQDTTAAGVDYVVTGEIALNWATEHWMRATSASLTRHPRLADYHHEHTTRLGIVALSAEVDQVHAIVQSQFGPRVFSLCIRVPSAGVDVLEIFDPTVNKWQGVLHVARHHGVQPDQVIAIGDDLNDLAMLENAGLAIAMGNARPEVRALANRVIPSNAEDGLAQYLEELIAAEAPRVIDPAA